MRVLAINPFHGGSHRQFLHGVRDHSRHDWKIVAGRPVHWKWRMRSAPLEMADVVGDHIDANGYPDLLFCTDMLDLPSFRGMIRDPTLMHIPTIIYFHENQWSYPLSPHARPDNHFGYTNLLSAFAADACWFNSHFHQEDFFAQSEAFVARMPDGHKVHGLDDLKQRSRVISPGFNPAAVQRPVRNLDPVTIGWVSRWEYDKRPDLFLDLLRMLRDEGTDFRLILLGARPNSIPKDLQKIRQHFDLQIIHDGFAQSNQRYWELLAEMDFVVSTADHEFFGIAVCEAIWAGAVPVVPNRLSYPELVPESCLFNSLDQAASLVRNLADPTARRKVAESCREKIDCFTLDNTVNQIDDAIKILVQKANE